MYPVTQTFLNVVRAGGFTRTTTADVYFKGQYVTTVPIAGGSVDIDRTADIRRSCNITIADQTFVPQFVNSPISPYGAELVINSGIAYDNGQVEMAQLGVFRIEQVTWDEAGGSLPQVTGYDRAKVLSDAQFLLPIDRSGVNIFTLITGLVNDVCSSPVIIDPLYLKNIRLPGGTIFQTDRLAALSTCAQALGAENFFDVHGNYIVQPVSGLSQSDIATATPVWEVDASPTGVLVDASRGVSRTGVANAIAVTGTASGTGANPMGWAADVDARSPTYWGPATSLPFGPWTLDTFGTFGQVVKNISNSMCTTAEQCTIAAQGELKKSLGLARSLDFTCVWNPALQEGDIIRLTYLDGSQELHIIDKLHIPIGSNSEQMTASTRTLTYQITAHT